MLSSKVRRRWSTSLLLVCLSLLAAACTTGVMPTSRSAESQADRPAGTTEQPTLSWRRDGGIAGFCDGLAVWGTDRVAVASCEIGDLDRQSALPLPSSHRSQLEGWVEQYASFEWEHSDPPEASDRLRISLVFQGRGPAAAPESEKEAMASFAQELYVLMSRADESR